VRRSVKALVEQEKLSLQNAADHTDAQQLLYS
jgi:hypothetical protein